MGPTVSKGKFPLDFKLIEVKLEIGFSDGARGMRINKGHCSWRWPELGRAGARQGGG